jgi:Gluconate 2-dehydrogenase subunit 3
VPEVRRRKSESEQTPVISRLHSPAVRYIFSLVSGHVTKVPVCIPGLDTVAARTRSKAESEDIMAGQGMDRREVLRSLALAAAASSFPGFWRWSFACGDHVNGGASTPRAVNYTPQFFSHHEYATVERLADLIIPGDGTPGAKEAGVAEFIDFMVAHNESIQYSFRLGLTRLDAESERMDGSRFLDLTAEKQTEMLGHLAFRDRYRSGEEDGRAFFELAREYTVMGYYTSRIGLKELDYPGLRPYAESPGCPHKGDPEHRHIPPPKF